MWVICFYILVFLNFSQSLNLFDIRHIPNRTKTKREFLKIWAENFQDWVKIGLETEVLKLFQMASSDMLEFMSPAKLCLALWIREYVIVLRNYNPRHESQEMDDSEVEWLKGEKILILVASYDNLLAEWKINLLGEVEAQCLERLSAHEKTT